MGEPSKKQDERQATRHNGRYAKYPRCYGCGKTIGHDYASHPMTDCIGDDNEPWHDTALVLCDPCYTKTDHMRNVSEFIQYRDTRWY
jgi:hypothetical protein